MANWVDERDGISAGVNAIGTCHRVCSDIEFTTD